MSNELDAAELTAPIPVPDAVSNLLLRILEGWSPPMVVPGPITAMRVGGTDCSDMEPRIEISADRLIVRLRNAHTHRRLRELLPFSMDHEVEGELAGGGKFRAGDIVRVSLSADLTIDTTTWAVECQDDGPSLWVGWIEGALTVDYGGNLIIERARDDGLRLGRACHFRLSGAYTYYLAQRDSSKAATWHIVVDALSGMLDRDALERDFQVLQFVFGCQLRVPALLRVATDGRTTGATAGLGTRNNLNPHSVPPVPINRDNDGYIDESWATLLFERTSATLLAQPDARTPFWMAIDAYLDGMGRHLDADYLRVQVGVEAFAYWLLRLANGSERMVVRDKAVWKKWVKENSAAIRALAVEGFEESLYQKVMNVYRLSSGRVVPSAFLEYGLPLTKELVLELEGRNDIVHQGLMAPEGYDEGRELRRIAMIRTLLVALVSKAVRYDGAINGWDVGKFGYPLVPSEWWQVREDDRQLACRTYIADDGGARKRSPVPTSKSARPSLRALWRLFCRRLPGSVSCGTARRATWGNEK